MDRHTAYGDVREVAIFRVLERNRVATLDGQRVADRLAWRAHLGARHTGTLQSLNRVDDRNHPRPLLDRGGQCPIIPRPCRPGRESRILAEVRSADRLEQGRRALLTRRRHRDVAVDALVQAERAQARHRLAGARWNAKLLEQVKGLDRHQRRQCTYHGGVNPLTNAREAHMLECRQNADDRVQRRDAVAQWGAQTERWIGLFSSGEHYPAERLGNGIRGAAAAWLALDAKPGQRRPHDAWIGAQHEVEPETEFVERTPREVVDHSVAAGNEVAQYLCRAGPLEIERNAQLVAV